MGYWLDDDWYVGRLKEVPGLFSQGETLQELEENIRDAYELVQKEIKGRIATVLQHSEIKDSLCQLAQETTGHKIKS